ncbi:MAG: hypothetical protein K2Y21_11230 [Phycisphaerales bacterium]|nr:hypothetical protein [Phycisphaerales bacterium]
MNPNPYAALGLGLIALLSAAAIADQARVPSNGNGVELTSGQEGPIGGTAARRFMMVMDTRSLSGIPVGSRIVGLRFRLDSFNAAAWPPAAVVISDYELRISAAATTASTISPTYAANISGSQTLVKDGAMAIAANAYPAGATPRAFGPLISFDTEFVYNGGSLCLDFNHTGTAAGVTGFMDANDAPVDSFVRGLYESNRAAVTGILTSAPIIEFEYIAPTNTVVPAAFAGTAGPSNQEGQIGGTSVRRFQFNIDEAALGIPKGSVITGLSFRRPASFTSAWPPSNVTISDYEVRVGPGVAAGAMTTTYASNFTAQTLVYDGPLDLNNGAFPADATAPTPEAFGLVVPFSTPYPYFGGNLSIDINYSGTGLGLVGSMDAVLGSDFATNGIRGLYSAASRTAATGGLANPPVTRIFYTAGPSPDLAQGVTKVYLADRFAVNPAPGALNTLVQSTARTNVIVAAADQFDTIGTGSQIVGHAARADSTPWPAAISSFGNYEVTLSRSPTTPATISATFANNIGTDSVVTRTGALSIPANSFLPPGSGPSAPFSFTLPYSTPYTYLGGPLSLRVRHNGGSQAPILLDAISTIDPAYGSAISAVFVDSDSSATGISGGATVLRLDVDAASNVPRGAAAPNGTGITDLLGTIDYSFQQIIAAEELRDIPVGSLIDHLWFRNNSVSVATPISDSITSDFEVEMSTSARRPMDISTTFATNIGADNIRVHDGMLAVAAGTLPAGATGKHGMLVRFQRAFVYRGGDVCLTIRHRGFTVDSGNIEAPTVATSLGAAVFRTSFGAATGTQLGFGGRVAGLRLGYTPSVCTPNDLSTTEGANGQSNLGSNSTMQMIIPAEQLRSIDVGSAITGMSFRNSSSGGGASFPTADFTFTRFDVRVAPTSRNPLATSSDLATNVGAGEVVVREGPMFVPKNAFPASGSLTVPSEFAWFITFDRAFVYQGGNLCITIRAEGTPPGNTFLDTNGSTPSAQGSMRYASGNPDALIAPSTWGPFVTRFAFTARAFCPWDLNNDGAVDDGDFLVFVLAYNTLDCADAGMPEGCPADFNFDRVVDDLDFQAFVGPYNTLVCPE